MSSLTRNQEYSYQYRCVAVASNTTFCGNGPRLNMAIPDNLLDIKAIYMHAVLLFDISTPSGQRVIQYAGGKYNTTNTGIPIPATSNLIKVNVAADPTTRIADCRVDITDLKAGLMTANPYDFNQPTIELNLITDIDGGFDVSGKVILWKVDIVYTTKGIQ